MRRDIKKACKRATHTQVELFRNISKRETEAAQDLGRRCAARLRLTFQLAEAAVIGPMLSAILFVVRRLRAQPPCSLQQF